MVRRTLKKSVTPVGYALRVNRKRMTNRTHLESGGSHICLNQQKSVPSKFNLAERFLIRLALVYYVTAERVLRPVLYRGFVVLRK